MLKLLYRAEHCAVMTLLLKQPKTINAKEKKFFKIQLQKKKKKKSTHTKENKTFLLLSLL